MKVVRHFAGTAFCFLVLASCPGVHAQQPAPTAPETGLAAAAAALAAPPTQPDPELTVPAGTKVLLSVQSAVNTKTARPGDGVYLVSTFPVIVGAHVLIPSGVYVQGVIDSVERPGRVKGRAKLMMHFTTMIFPNGQVVSIPGGVNSLPGSDGAHVKNAEGEIEQSSNLGKDAADIAKGAAAGAGGGVIGGGAVGHPIEGAGYGAAAGAVGGLIYTLFTRGNDITIAQGASVEMVLQRPLQLEASQLAGIDDASGRPQYVPAQQQQPLPKPRRILCPPDSLGCN
jgi:type IV secretion system protein VirB10